ncbi:Aldehyde dehydrogenase [Penicillium canariense]|uniref:Aldehyde dehydrogenase n=1 Tax=Penicillium canariense TaxID=189055 RepID=A0A9W9IEW8_9EURO|nr:Aldehyde dehydrogenase [Penicillium canariense]KAJ5176378.1 Aldehyde dehydrogenase [Penicillium canariense]
MASLSVQLTAPNGRVWSQPTGLFINNQWVKSSDGDKIASINPATATEITSVYAGSAEDVNTAVKAARAALNHPSWRDLPGSDRGKLMNRLAQLIEDNRETLATIETCDNGKPYTVSRDDDLTETAETIRYFSGYADKIFGQVIGTTPDKFAYTMREPMELPAFYGRLEAWPCSGMRQYYCLEACRADAAFHSVPRKPDRGSRLPPGVVNIVNGHGAVAGAALASHMDVDKIAFTGSTATAKHIMKMASVNLKNITLETGGKSPLVVFDDADLEQAVEWAHIGIMYNQGQICTATSRILVQDKIYDKFLAAFKAQVKNVSKVGDPFEESTFQGPQVTQAQYDRIMSYVDVGKSEGATLSYGGKPFKGVGNGKGFFVEPTVFTDVSPNMRIYKEEVFGPFVAIARFSTEEEAIQMANDTTYGLGSAIFTTNLTRAHRVAKKIEAGMVWINSSNDSDWRIPFGGVKQSGIGRELGEAGLDAYSNIKAVHVNMKSKL